MAEIPAAKTRQKDSKQALRVWAKEALNFLVKSLSLFIRGARVNTKAKIRLGWKLRSEGEAITAAAKNMAELWLIGK
jgi:hypothetical protein